MLQPPVGVFQGEDDPAGHGLPIVEKEVFLLLALLRFVLHPPPALGVAQHQLHLRALPEPEEAHCAGGGGTADRAPRGRERGGADGGREPPGSGGGRSPLGRRGRNAARTANAGAARLTCGAGISGPAQLQRARSGRAGAAPQPPTLERRPRLAAHGTGPGRTQRMRRPLGAGNRGALPARSTGAQAPRGPVVSRFRCAQRAGALEAEALGLAGAGGGARLVGSKRSGAMAVEAEVPRVVAEWRLRDVREGERVAVG